ncbi:alpha/beta-Hydrolases superfamily protein, partial [Thalictrum thalictroides]
MGVSAARPAVTMIAKAINEVLSFLVFSILDLFDVLLCFLYKVADFFIEAEWKPCYCSSSAKELPINTNTSSGNDKIVVSQQQAGTGTGTGAGGRGDSKIVCVCSTNNKLELDDISDTLYTRKISGRPQSSVLTPRWSDCDCITCSSWTSSRKDTLFVHSQGPKDNAKEDVLFIHGFISSSTFWTETLFPNFSAATKSSHRLFAVDLLGFGKSPKPTDSLYTLREHIDMIERSTIEPYKMQSFHIVAHSLGCILALAIAVKYPKAIKSLTLLAPFTHFVKSNGYLFYLNWDDGKDPFDQDDS